MVFQIVNAKNEPIVPYVVEDRSNSFEALIIQDINNLIIFLSDKMKCLLNLVIIYVLYSNLAFATSVYKCGNSYQAMPCPNENKVNQKLIRIKEVGSPILSKKNIVNNENSDIDGFSVGSYIYDSVKSISGRKGILELYNIRKEAHEKINEPFNEKKEIIELVKDFNDGTNEMLNIMVSMNKSEKLEFPSIDDFQSTRRHNTRIKNNAMIRSFGNEVKHHSYEVGGNKFDVYYNLRTGGELKFVNELLVVDK